MAAGTRNQHNVGGKDSEESEDEEHNTKGEEREQSEGEEREDPAE
jgi:hypothetical protein